MSLGGRYLFACGLRALARCPVSWDGLTHTGVSGKVPCGSVTRSLLVFSLASFQIGIFFKDGRDFQSGVLINDRALICG